MTPQALAAETAPRTAYEAADRLADDGHHVHVAANGESLCHSGHCHRTPKEPRR
ncbi:hypothetical protein ACFWAA_33520 [Streptomyces sp. NPDC059922]|uniref:hypothetical protein n=1 Tax=Streptomyces sp. NPDC059922 TaxID=3347005 RepID=UPI00365C888A